LIHKPNFFVFTGGPGVGKTTLIRQLEAMGELVVAESARAVIREQMACGGAGAPWIDPKAFCELTVERDIANFDRMADETRRVFFDRGVTDSYRAEGVEPWPEFLEAIWTRRYNARVFVFPPWREIYETDAEFPAYLSMSGEQIDRKAELLRLHRRPRGRQDHPAPPPRSRGRTRGGGKRPRGDPRAGGGRWAGRAVDRPHGVRASHRPA